MELNQLDINEIMALIPHRYPMLLLDKIMDMKGDDSAIGIKNVTINEPVFQGHFPGHPVFPGVLILEALGQTAAVTVMAYLKKKSEDCVVYFMSIEQAKFRKLILPGDQVHLHITKKQNRGNVWKYHGEAKVNGVVHAEALLTAMIVDKDKLDKA